PNPKSATTGPPSGTSRSASTSSTSSGGPQSCQEPSTTPAARSNQPARSSWVRQRSIRYGASVTSSSSTIAPSGGGGTAGPPSVAASRLTVPPAVGPVARPPTSVHARGPPSSTGGGSNRARRRCSTACGSRTASVATIAPNSVTTPQRGPSAACRAVMSLAPTNRRGGAAAIASQSSRSITRRAPYPPRPQSTAAT